MRKGKRREKTKIPVGVSSSDEYWYDLNDPYDFDLIEASFQQQYGIDIVQYPGEEDMTWRKFKILLSGLLPETPLGKIVQIRSENDPDVLKGYTMQQHAIRNKWRRKKQEDLYGIPPKEQSYAVLRALMDAYKK